MLDRIIQFSIKNKLIIGLLTLALMGWGTYSLTQLPIDAVPDITDNQVMIITISPTLAAQEVEQLVTFPVEQIMISIPETETIRSFSRFGLSIVTIVFKESTDLYWARQQVQERLSSVVAEIPKGIGKPTLAPITTGLGEIYQYALQPKPGYEDQYDVTKLRTIQDWIVKRQLLGTPGVAEVSSFGGYLKQYEIALNPDRLNSLNITLQDVFAALEKNNQNTGGAYIDKNPHTYFIRSEGLIRNIDEIKKVVIKPSKEGKPILIRDIAKVQLGQNVRYGAATKNGKGEIVTGIVMMLKGANSSEVITNVKNKIEQIKQTLPEGVIIEPYLDRKKLVDGAISTVVANLIEGALIVIFVLILFLGNLRGGLIVASVIPLSMLFAVSMMNLFGVSGNLMSLGAIDFGIIIDGAVIIVEAVLHGIFNRQKQMLKTNKLSVAQMDEEVYNSSKKIRLSAAFGEIIILIVYLPILTLIGVEGKMFTPMAQTVSFAILGAFILSLTYVPMMSALILSRHTLQKRTLSDRLMDFCQKIYRPIIIMAIHYRLFIVIASFSLFLLTMVVFSRMGGEFMPQLDEGDFAVETRVPTGSSIQQSIAVSQKAQTILLNQYPEVKQVVNKIGSGEIPTDPMPIEAGDMMIILKPRNKWVSAQTREELIEKMQASLSVIPNATFSFQQPIQMRFNELLTGAKQDVVIKIYGENLNTLAELANKVGRKIKSVEGVSDLYIEKITGLPQIQVKFNRDKIAQYGMNITAINDAIKTAFAGKPAGLIYEGERRFDLVVRLDKSYRVDIQDVHNLYVSKPSGEQIPLKEVAMITYTPGPVQIQRDNAKRRITIGFNVRNRDVKSIIKDIQEVIGNKVNLPAGYYITYGGQFKNLQEANKRLMVAVPIALLLILCLLYFTFRSIKQSFLIFTAIPFSAIGGVFALLIRGMPFSISAGVGFIALFGVAVLNGIVLIAEFNRLAKEGVANIRQRVLQGTQIRLRPVLMTAMVASLGFLPMAASTTAGAEVQKPLATVVIGGLFTATLLTLIVLPVLYIYFSNARLSIKLKPQFVCLLGVVFFTSLSTSTQAQKLQPSQTSETKMSLTQAITTALNNNYQIQVSSQQIDKAKMLKRAAVALPKTELSFTQGVVSNPTIQDNILGISQRFSLPILYKRKISLAKAKIDQVEQHKLVVQNALVSKIKNVYLRYSYTLELKKLYQQQDSIYSDLSRFSAKRYQLGEATKLEKITASTRSLQIKNRLRQLNSDLHIAQRRLQTLLSTSQRIALLPIELTVQKFALPVSNQAFTKNPILGYLQKIEKTNQQKIKIAKSQILPEIILGYNSQTYNGRQTINGIEHNFSGSRRFSFYKIGVSLPLFPGGYRAKINKAKINTKIAQTNIAAKSAELWGRLAEFTQTYNSLQHTIAYYQSQALPQAQLIITNSKLGFKSGNISYAQHSQNLVLAINIQTEYLDYLFQNNQIIIAIETLLGIQ